MSTPSSAGAAKKPATTPYFHNGQVLASPPLSVTLRRMAVTAYCFIGLYLVTLFTFNPIRAAQNSPLASRNQAPDAKRSGKFPSFFPSSGGGGGGPGGPPGGGGGGRPFGSGRRLGTVDQVRGPECGSCRGLGHW